MLIYQPVAVSCGIRLSQCGTAALNLGAQSTCRSLNPGTQSEYQSTNRQEAGDKAPQVDNVVFNLAYSRRKGRGKGVSYRNQPTKGHFDSRQVGRVGLLNPSYKSC